MNIFRWFQRRRNRRFAEREFVLDVKLRTRQMRVARWRAAGMGLAGIAGVALFILAVWKGGAWFLDDAVYENPKFTIRHVDIHTDGAIAPWVIKLLGPCDAARDRICSPST